MDRDPPQGSRKNQSQGSLRPVTDAAQQSNKLLRLLAAQILRIFIDDTLPFKLKVFLIPLLFLIPLYSVITVVFFGDLVYCIARDRDMYFSHYLILLGTSAPLMVVILLTFGVVSNKFENSRALEEQFQSVTDARRPRQRVSRGGR